jgi:hypothetical protein
MVASVHKERTVARWITWGLHRGQGPLRMSKEDADADVDDDEQAARTHGIDSDLCAYWIDLDGWLIDALGDHVRPYGRGRALRIGSNDQIVLHPEEDDLRPRARTRTIT